MLLRKFSCCFLRRVYDHHWHCLQLLEEHLFKIAFCLSISSEWIEMEKITWNRAQVTNLILSQTKWTCSLANVWNFMQTCTLAFFDFECQWKVKRYPDWWINYEVFILCKWMHLDKWWHCMSMDFDCINCAWCHFNVISVISLSSLSFHSFYLSRTPPLFVQLLDVAP